MPALEKSLKCALPWCDAPRSPKAGKGLCQLHYGQTRRGVPPGPSRRAQRPTACGFPDCSEPPSARGLCKRHYMQKRHSGVLSQLGPRRRRSRPGQRCEVRGCARRLHSVRWCQLHYHVWHAFGLEPQRYEDLLAAQGGGCAICRNKCSTHRRLSVDHDHLTGEIRGLLCASCNRGIGLLGDNADMLLRAFEYLRDASIRKVA